jgi:hypothetical protein
METKATLLGMFYQFLLGFPFHSAVSGASSGKILVTSRVWEAGNYDYMDHI